VDDILSGDVPFKPIQTLPEFEPEYLRDAKEEASGVVEFEEEDAEGTARRLSERRGASGSVTLADVDDEEGEEIALDLEIVPDGEEGEEMVADDELR
jgi:hypothetical protein